MEPRHKTWHTGSLPPARPSPCPNGRAGEMLAEPPCLLPCPSPSSPALCHTDRRHPAPPGSKNRLVALPQGR